ncbi:MAG: D-tagatose-bisphosphate aldolase, class II, non-catalytic subunit [Roseiarcus sp.]
MTRSWLADLPRRHRLGDPLGVASVCSAHPWVIEATLTAGSSQPALIEATCNQVNQEGGYTGMTPSDFRDFVRRIAEAVGFDASRLTLGGDHLGPNPWRNLDAEAAMRRAEAMVVAYVEAGFTKIHLDASMGCLGEPPALDDERVAERTARLALAAETAADRLDSPRPIYVVGTEVPTPGGANHALSDIAITRPEAALRTLAVQEAAFARRNLEEAFDRVIALVVQPGVEFDNSHVKMFEPSAAKDLAAALAQRPGVVFEAHSTDYQPATLLKALVSAGFAILKVGPALTFAMREALYGLDAMATQLRPERRDRSLKAVMEQLMLAEPAHWAGRYPGSENERRLLRHYSYSDRIRYYWPRPPAASAVAELIAELDSAPLPETLISQFLPQCYPAARDGLIAARPRILIDFCIKLALKPYLSAAGALGASGR